MNVSLIRQLGRAGIDLERDLGVSVLKSKYGVQSARNVMRRCCRFSSYFTMQKCQDQVRRSRSISKSSISKNNRDIHTLHPDVFYPKQSWCKSSYYRSRPYGKYVDLGEMSPEEKAKLFQRPKSQTTIDEDEVNKFAGLSALWWNECGEFEALHSLNELRIPWIRDALVSQKKLPDYNMTKPLEGLWILDVGSGGGILSEPLARLGASVIGLEASEENIKIAQVHLLHDPVIRDKIKYIQATVEEIADTQEGKFDAVVASEVLEHVADANIFVSSSCKLVRPGGSIFFTTLNKTRLSYYLGIVVAERFLKLLSPGTHDWEKFVPPVDLQNMLEQNKFSTRLVHGMQYNPFSKRWMWSKDTSINYAIHAVSPA